MVNNERQLRWLVVGSCLLLTGGCTCSERPPAHNDKPKAIRVKPKQPTRPPPSVSEQMQKIQRFTEEMRRRVRGGVTVKGPAKVIGATLKQVDVGRFPKKFKMFYDGMVARTEAMAESKQPGPDYNKLVDRCLACHALFAQDYMDLIKRLRLPPEQFPKPRAGKPPPGPQPREPGPPPTSGGKAAGSGRTAPRAR